tara:strand:+ start:1235 stop:1636 length:402 start_codon:yes stop_codon:yes gene_type:complete
MKEIIKEVLDGMSGSQMNLESDGARELISSTISTELKKRGHYRKFPTDNNETKHFADGFHEGRWEEDMERHSFPGLDVILKEKDRLVEQISDTRPDGDGTEWIYESSDGGKTIYKRAVGSDEKILVKDINDER